MIRYSGLIFGEHIISIISLGMYNEEIIGIGNYFNKSYFIYSFFRILYSIFPIIGCNNSIFIITFSMKIFIFMGNFFKKHQWSHLVIVYS